MTSEFDFSSFEHSTNDDGNDLYKKTYSDAAYVLFTDGAGYASNVVTIKYWYDSEESYTPPGGIVRELRAVYPDLSYDEAESILIDAKAKNSYVGYEYRDVKLHMNTTKVIVLRVGLYHLNNRRKICFVQNAEISLMMMLYFVLLAETKWQAIRM